VWQLAKKLVRDYVALDAPHAVNLLHATRERLLAAVREELSEADALPPDLLDAAQYVCWCAAGRCC